MHQPRSSEPSRSEVNRKQSLHPSSWLALPAPIRVMFDRFPIVTYNENDLPQRALVPRSTTKLYMFALDDEELSPNPACLKWQLFLHIQGIAFATHSSNNHASPTGALPFLLPAVKSKTDPIPQAISSSKIQRWAETQGAKEENMDLKLEAYLSLIDQNIRNAWLYHLYLVSANFNAVARKLYIETASSNTFVRATLGNQLQAAAKDQLLRTRSFIDAEEIYEQADAAFTALNTLLDQRTFFSNNGSPGLFDASLVAYTHLIIDLENTQRPSGIRWHDHTLSKLLSQHERLISHRDNVLEICKSRSAD